jgi:hypothetical protein
LSAGENRYAICVVGLRASLSFDHQTFACPTKTLQARAHHPQKSKRIPLHTAYLIILFCLPGSASTPPPSRFHSRTIPSQPPGCSSLLCVVCLPFRINFTNFASLLFRRVSRISFRKFLSCSAPWPSPVSLASSDQLQLQSSFRVGPPGHLLFSLVLGVLGSASASSVRVRPPGRSFLVPLGFHGAASADFQSGPPGRSPLPSTSLPFVVSSWISFSQIFSRVRGPLALPVSSFLVVRGPLAVASSPFRINFSSSLCAGSPCSVSFPRISIFSFTPLLLHVSDQYVPRLTPAFRAGGQPSGRLVVPLPVHVVSFGRHQCASAWTRFLHHTLSWRANEPVRVLSADPRGQRGLPGETPVWGPCTEAAALNPLVSRPPHLPTSPHHVHRCLSRVCTTSSRECCVS